MKKIKKIREKEKFSTSQVIECPSSMYVLEANRQLSSKWTIQVNVKVSMKLPDGRVLVVDEIKNLPAKQIGRREKKKSQSLMNALDEAGLLED